MKVTQASITDYATDAAAVQVFCENRGLVDYAPLAVDLVKECVDLVSSPSLSVDINDETGEEFLLLEFKARDGVQGFLADYHRLISRWVQAVPLPQRLMVVFCYNIAK